MRQEVFEIVQTMDRESVATQLAVQCAPLLVGLKVSNLLILSHSSENAVAEALKGTDLSCLKLSDIGCKTVFFLYRESTLTEWLLLEENKEYLCEAGYRDINLDEIFDLIQVRYQAYSDGKCGYPHEIGILLGYPVSDVRGFIDNEGKNYLYSGYWKVYDNLQETKRLFNKFDRARETLINLVSRGVSIRKIVERRTYFRFLHDAA